MPRSKAKSFEYGGDTIQVSLYTLKSQKSDIFVDNIGDNTQLWHWENPDKPEDSESWVDEAMYLKACAAVATITGDEGEEVI